MARVGDIILGAREQFTDLCQKLDPPSGIVVATQSTTVPYFPAGTYYFVVTQLNLFGESLGSDEQAVAISGNNTFKVTLTPAPGVTTARVYIGTASGQENIFQTLTGLTPLASNIVNLAVIGTCLAGGPPNRSTAYLPDTNGNALSVDAIYRWLNEGLNLASTICDGLPDFSAIGSVDGVGVYEFTGNWQKVSQAWYDGYPIDVGNKNGVFRRNAVTGIAGQISMFQNTNRVVLEIWPQASRTSGQTTLTGAMTPTDTVANIAASNFVLSFGLAKIGTEIVYFAFNNSGQLQNLIRGMAGTVPQVWPGGTPVTELNVMITGHRTPTPYAVGSANSTFYLPEGWEDAMETYLVSRFRKAEQDTQGAATLLQAFKAQVKDLSANKIIAGPRQIQVNASRGPETYPGLGSFAGGGVIVP